MGAAGREREIQGGSGVDLGLQALAGARHKGQPKRELQDRCFHGRLAGIDDDEGQFAPLLQPVGPLNQGISPFEQDDAAAGAEVLAGQAEAVLQAAALAAAAA